MFISLDHAQMDEGDLSCHSRNAAAIRMQMQNVSNLHAMSTSQMHTSEVADRVGGRAVDILAWVHLPETVARLLEVVLLLLWNVLQHHCA